MTPNQPKRDEPYSLQAVGAALRTVIKGDDALWADQVHTHWQGGHYSPKNKGDRPLLLRAMFRAIRILEVGTVKQQKQAGDLKRFLENVWGLQKAYVAAAEGDIDAMRELRERWGDAQLPPKDGGFVNGIAADEAIIDAIVRRLG